MGSINCINLGSKLKWKLVREIVLKPCPYSITMSIVCEIMGKGNWNTQMNNFGLS